MTWLGPVLGAILGFGATTAENQNANDSAANKNNAAQSQEQQQLLAALKLLQNMGQNPINSAQPITAPTPVGGAGGATLGGGTVASPTPGAGPSTQPAQGMAALSTPPAQQRQGGQVAQTPGGSGGGQQAALLAALQQALASRSAPGAGTAV